MENKDYVIFSNRRWDSLSDSSFRRYSCRETLYSGRISTGVFGFTDCSSGNRGPKNKNEVLLAEGDEGLRELIDFGFIPCPTCHPLLAKAHFLDGIEFKIKEKYGFEDVRDFLDKKKLPFDARRLNWQKITELTNEVPGRIYVPQGLSLEEMNNFADKFWIETGFRVPPIGYYDANSPTRFTEYKILAK
jgi:hypothetical protein